MWNPFKTQPKASKETYPQSALYRNNQAGVEKQAEAFLKEFLDAKHFKKHVGRLFSISEADVARLTPEEIQDIKNYARYAYKRLVASSIHSGLHADLMTEDKKGRVDVKKIATEGVLAGSDIVEHDLLHALVAYARSGGATSRPNYDTAEKRADSEAIGEEMFVHLFWTGGSEDFLEHCFKGGDPVEKIKESRGETGEGAKEVLAPQKEIYSRLDALRPLKESDPVEYVMRAYELYWEQQFGKNEKLTSFMRVNNDPAYRAVVTALYENFTSETPDPLVRFREFQRITEPLLERLRKEQS